MSSSSQLHHWLKQEESAGTLESRGHFTLEQSKAWEKLGNFQLPFQEAWVLKLVQAGMSSEHTQLSINQSREETTFRYTGIDIWVKAEVEAAIFDIAFKGADELSHLVIAVRALALQKTRPFSIQYANGEIWAWTGQAFALLEGLGQTGLFQIVVANYKFGQSKSFLSLSQFEASKFRASVSKALTDHCHLCPKGLTFDGRGLNGFETDASFGIGQHSQPLIVLKTECLDDCPPLSVASKLSERLTKVGDTKISVPENMLVEQPDLEYFGTAGILSIFYEAELIRRDLRMDKTIYKTVDRESKIYWLSDGVVVQIQSLAVSAPVGIAAIVSAKGLATDLSGLVPLQNAEKEQRLLSSLSLLEAQLTRFRQELGLEGLRVTGINTDAKVAGVAGAVMMLAVPVIGAAFLAKAGFNYHKSKRVREQLDHAYNEGLDAVIECLRDRTWKTRRAKEGFDLTSL